MNDIIFFSGIIDTYGNKLDLSDPIIQDAFKHWIHSYAKKTFTTLELLSHKQVLTPEESSLAQKYIQDSFFLFSYLELFAPTLLDSELPIKKIIKTPVDITFNEVHNDKGECIWVFNKKKIKKKSLPYMLQKLHLGGDNYLLSLFLIHRPLIKEQITQLFLNQGLNGSPQNS